MSTDMIKFEVEGETCCVCGGGGELTSPDEHDADTQTPVPLRTMLLQLNNNKVVPDGRLCSNCIRRAMEAYEFSSALSTKGAPPLSEKIRALRRRLHELTRKIDVFIVVGGAGGGAYGEDDIIMVEREALAAAAAADDADLERARNARGDSVYQCSVCPLSFQFRPAERDGRGVSAARGGVPGARGDARRRGAALVLDVRRAVRLAGRAGGARRLRLRRGAGLPAVRAGVRLGAGAAAARGGLPAALPRLPRAVPVARGAGLALRGLARPQRRRRALRVRGVLPAVRHGRAAGGAPAAAPAREALRLRLRLLHPALRRQEQPGGAHPEVPRGRGGRGRGRSRGGARRGRGRAGLRRALRGLRHLRPHVRQRGGHETARACSSQQAQSASHRGGERRLCGGRAGGGSGGRGGVSGGGRAGRLRVRGETAAAAALIALRLDIAASDHLF